MGVHQLRPALLIASITTLAIFSLYSLQEVALAKIESNNYPSNTVSSKDDEHLPKIKSQNTFPITSSSQDNEEIDLEPEKTESEKVWVCFKEKLLCRKLMLEHFMSYILANLQPLGVEMLSKI